MLNLVASRAVARSVQRVACVRAVGHLGTQLSPLIPSSSRAVATRPGFTRRRSQPSVHRLRFMSQLHTMQQTMDSQAVLQQVEEVVGKLRHEPTVSPAPPIVVIVSGPSGVGKDAVVQGLKDGRPDLYFVVTATSRPMRVGEVEGRDYFFVTKQKFEEWITGDQLLEHAVVYGEYKGIPRQQVDEALSKGTDVVLRIDVQGAETVRRLVPQAVSIFLVAESERKLAERLLSRKTEPWDKLLTRVNTARQETQRLNEFDYVVVNEEGKLAECVAQISAIIDAEKCRVTRRMPRPPTP